MSTRKTIGCDLCDEIAVFINTKNGALKKPDGWGLVRYAAKKNGQDKEYKRDLCPKHSKEFENKYLNND